MGKKKQKEMENHRSRFVDGCSKNKISENIARSIFDKMEKFAGYGFNKSTQLHMRYYLIKQHT